VLDRVHVGVVIGNGSTTLAAGVVIKRKPTCLRFQDEDSQSAKKSQLRQCTRIGTWNVTTMTTDGKMEIIGKEMINIRAASELPLVVGSTLDRHRSLWHKWESLIIYSSSESKREAGVGMILDKQTS